MRETINTIMHGVGCMAIMIGVVVMVGAGGNSDLGQPMANVLPFLFKGFGLLLCGTLLAGWTI